MKAEKEFLLFQIKVEGFAFFQLSMPQDLINKILDIQFEYHPTGPGEDSRWVVPVLPSTIELELRKWLKSSHDLKDIVDDLIFDAHTFKKGEFLKVHNDSKDKGAYQLLIWICENDQFEGREFLYGLELDGKRQLKSKKVSTGLVCVMDINNENFIHGVSTLNSDIKIVTVQGFHKN